MDTLTTDGITLTFNPDGGTIADLALTFDDSDQVLHPLHRAPWVSSGEALPASVAPVERQLAGDFFCAPFGFAGNGPIHGWTANGTWSRDEVRQDVDGALTATYSLKEAVQGASVTKTFILAPGHPFVYQNHVFAGGAGHMPVAHHAMIRTPGGARPSFSPKAFGVTPSTALETDPARGRSILRYPQRFTDLAMLAAANGETIDASTYPFAKAHEDIVILAEEPGVRIGWSAALAEKDGFLFFAVKNARQLPETILWMSNGGRSYPPWNSRHTAVLGMEEAATACHMTGAFDSTGQTSSDGLATGLNLGPDTRIDIRYGFGAIPAPAGWSRIADIKVARNTVTLIDDSGDTRTLPFLGSHFGLGA